MHPGKQVSHLILISDEATDNIQTRCSGTSCSISCSIWRLPAGEVPALGQVADCVQSIFLVCGNSSSDWRPGSPFAASSKSLSLPTLLLLCELFSSRFTPVNWLQATHMPSALIYNCFETYQHHEEYGKKWHERIHCTESSPVAASGRLQTFRSNVLRRFAVGFLQVGSSLTDKQLNVNIPEGLLLDNSGQSIRNVDIAPTDIFALLAGLAAASLDLLGNHQNFTFNNLIACLICCDILQVDIQLEANYSAFY